MASLPSTFVSAPTAGVFSSVSTPPAPVTVLLADSDISSAGLVPILAHTDIRRLRASTPFPAAHNVQRRARTPLSVQAHAQRSPSPLTEDSDSDDGGVTYPPLPVATKILVPRPTGAQREEPQVTLSSSTVAVIKATVAATATELLNLDKSFTRQTKEALAAYTRRMHASHPVLTNYAGDWLLQRYTTVYLKNEMTKRKTQKAASILRGVNAAVGRVSHSLSITLGSERLPCAGPATKNPNERHAVASSTANSPSDNNIESSLNERPRMGALPNKQTITESRSKIASVHDAPSYGSNTVS
ncbi:hypothetical protein C8R47DRAFT_1064277 [Mycena vitilis]|nr:hypothetical protein C8R47DRAFT_1064277 [Mycena vitilis]